MESPPTIHTTPPTLRPSETTFLAPISHVRLSKSTFRLTQTRKSQKFPGDYGQSVHSYVRIKNQAVYVIDTGFGGLKDYIDREILTGELAWAKGVPIFVVNTHSHPDHVGDNAAFVGATFVRSANSFLPDDVNVVKLSDTSPQIHPQLLHLITPGHSADGLTIYDATERRLYCGDLIQPHSPCVLGPDADWNQWNRTLGKLISFVDDINEENSVPGTPSATTPNSPFAYSPMTIWSPKMEGSSLPGSLPGLPPPMLPLANKPISTPSPLQHYRTLTQSQLEDIANSMMAVKTKENRIILACGHGHKPSSAGEDASRALRIMAGIATGIRGYIVNEFTSDGSKLPQGHWIWVQDHQNDKFGILAWANLVPESVVARWRTRQASPKVL